MAENQESPMKNTKAAFSFEPADILHVLAQISRLGEVLKAEFDRIAARMSWLVIAESFLFLAFVTAIASYRPDHPVAGVLQYLAFVLPVVGMFLPGCVYVAIFAAVSAVATLKSQREQMMAGLPPPLRIDLISAHSRQERWGNLPALVIPPALFLIWAAALPIWYW
jgi:hypothetical protein